MGSRIFSTKNLITEFLLGVALLLALSLVRNILRVRSGERAILRAQQTLSQLQKENNELKKDLVKIKSESYVEKQSRDKLGLSAPGDVVLVLPEDAEIKKFSLRRKGREEVSLPDPIWKQWVDTFSSY